MHWNIYNRRVLRKQTVKLISSYFLKESGELNSNALVTCLFQPVLTVEQQNID